MPDAAKEANEEPAELVVVDEAEPTPIGSPLLADGVTLAGMDPPDGRWWVE